MDASSKRRPFKKNKIQNISSFAKKKITDTTKKTSKGDFTWQSLKSVIFIVCASSFLYQAAGFWKEYYTYPTKTGIAVTSPKAFKKPAVTVCNPNPVQRSKFCAENLDLCETPNNLPEFCQKHPHFCTGNVSNLLIPKLGYYASDMTWDVRDAIIDYLFIDDETYQSLFSVFISHNTKEPIGIIRKYFTTDSQGLTIIKCFSINFGLHSEMEPDIAIIDENDPVRTPFFYEFILNSKENETFFPWAAPEVLVSVHSPSEPVHPFDQGEVFYSGNSYTISVSLMCQELCNMAFSWNCYGCYSSVSMFEEMSEACTTFREKECDNINELKEIDLVCKEGCKIECLKLKFDYKVKHTTLSDTPSWYAPAISYKDKVRVVLQASDLDIVQIRHTPLYTNEELFSFIGGLMGCWLGISVFAFTEIFESVFQATVRFTKTLKKKRRSPDEVVVSSAKY